jgi:hypothetical protein
MPQYRKLYTKVTQSFDVNDMPDDFTRLVWLLLPLGVDCEGRGILNGSWIKSKIMPLRDDVASSQIIQAMDWFIERGMVITYEVDRRDYFIIPTFTQYQGDTTKESKSILPSPTPELVGSKSVPTPELVGSKSSTDSDADTDSDTDAAAEAAAGDKNTVAAAAQGKTAELEAIAVLNKAEIYTPTDQELAKLAWMTVEYVNAHAETARAQGDPTGLLVHRLRNHDPVPPKNGSPPRDYVAGEYADYVEH